MRVLLVTWTEQLLQKLSFLNPELEFCAVVTENVESAKKILEQVGLPQNLTYPIYELKECIENFYCDYVLCTDIGWTGDLISAVEAQGTPKDKIISLNFLGTDNFMIERALRYFKEHAAEFEMFATGISYTEVGLDTTRFKRKLFNFARSSQDLYYNFQIAKRAVLYGGA